MSERARSLERPIKFEDILDDFSVEQRTKYVQYIDMPLAEAANKWGDYFVYYDLQEFSLK